MLSVEFAAVVSVVLAVVLSVVAYVEIGDGEGVVELGAGVIVVAAVAVHSLPPLHLAVVLSGGTVDGQESFHGRPGLTAPVQADQGTVDLVARAGDWAWRELG